MHIQLETANKHSVTAYADTGVTVDGIVWKKSIIVSPEGVFSDWSITSITDLDETLLTPLLAHNPTIIIIGHTTTGKFPPIGVMAELSRRRVGLESMSIGAACRTYNVLLSEKREVVLGIILKPDAVLPAR